MDHPSPPPAPPLTFRGGLLGALAPMVVFLAGVTALAALGAPDERGFWPVLVTAWMLGIALAHDREAWSEAAITAVAQPIVVVMILAWLLAGVFGAILAEAGLVGSLVHVAGIAGVGPIGIVGVAFLTCAAISTATGTSFGTLLVAGPVLYAAGGALGADGPVLMGAVLAGATWGDSISPISDTSIASAGSQSTDVAGTVRARLQYVVPAGLIALAASLLWASRRPVTTPPPLAASEVGAATGVVMLLAPMLVIRMLLRRRPLLEGLLAGIGVAVTLGLVTGHLRAGALLHVEPSAFGARGVLVDGLGRGVGVSVFTILLMGLVGTLHASTALTQLLARVHGAAATPRRAEWLIVGLVSGAVVLTTHSVVAILAVGPVVSRLGTFAGVSAYRRANLLDLTVCTWPFLLPWFLPTILAASTTAGGAFPPLTPLAVGLHNTYAWALLITVPLAVWTGYGRRSEG